MKIQTQLPPSSPKRPSLTAGDAVQDPQDSYQAASPGSERRELSQRECTALVAASGFVTMAAFSYSGTAGALSGGAVGLIAGNLIAEKFAYQTLGSNHAELGKEFGRLAIIGAGMVGGAWAGGKLAAHYGSPLVGLAAGLAMTCVTTAMLGFGRSES